MPALQQLSPGVVFQEVDLTTTVPNISTTTGAFVGQFQWGPARWKTLITSEPQLVRTFLKPDSNTYLSFFSVANFLAYGGPCQVVRAVANVANNSTASGSGLLIPNENIYQNTYFGGGGFSAAGQWAGRYPGSISNGLIISLCPSANAFSSNLTTRYVANANTTINSNVITFSANVYGQLQINDLLTVGNQATVLVTNVATNGVLALINNASLITSTLAFAAASRQWQYARFFSGPPTTSGYASKVGGANDQCHVIIVDTQGSFTTTTVSPINIGGANTILEQYSFLSLASDAVNNDGSQAYIPSVIFSKSNYAYWMGWPTAGTNWGNTAAATTFTNVEYPTYSYMSGGQTGSPLDGDLESGWDLFNNPDEVKVSLLITGASDTTVCNYVLTSTVPNRQDCVAFISPQQNDVVNQPGSESTNVLATRNTYPSTTYGFMDSNWKYMYDKYNNVYRWVPLNPDIAGLCAQTDMKKGASWWSPAGYNRGLIKNVTRLAWHPNKAYRDILYSAGVNPALNFAGQGPLLFGDVTMTTQPSAFSRINVRRLFIYLEQTISLAAKYSLFEFNDEFTRSAFLNLVTPTLRQVQGGRGITNFQVVCDTTNNTPVVIQANQFIGDIYIVPNYSINFINLNFVAVGPSVTFNTVIGQF